VLGSVLEPANRADRAQRTLEQMVQGEICVARGSPSAASIPRRLFACERHLRAQAKPSNPAKLELTLHNACTLTQKTVKVHSVS